MALGEELKAQALAVAESVYDDCKSFVARNRRRKTPLKDPAIHVTAWDKGHGGYSIGEWLFSNGKESYSARLTDATLRSPQTLADAFIVDLVTQLTRPELT